MANARNFNRRWLKPSSAFRHPPRDPPKPDKLRPRSGQDLPIQRQDGHLAAILAHLGRHFAHLGASFAGICRKFVTTSGPSGPSFFVFLEPPDDDFHHFPRCVFLVFVSVVHLRFMLQFFFHIRFAHTCLGFFRTRPHIKLCYAGRFAKRAQSGVARLVLLRRVKITISNSKV